MHIKSTWLIDHCAKRPNWIPTKGRILLMQSKVTGLWRQPANKPIVNYLIWKAITGNTNGFNEQTRHLDLGKQKMTSFWQDTHTQKVKERERRRLTCASSVTDPCAASFVASRGSLCRWGQTAEVPSEGSFLFLEGPPKTCRQVRRAYSVEHDVEEILAETGASVTSF